MGSKTISLTRDKVLSARQRSWDQWETKTHALARARAILLKCMDDTEAKWGDRLKAIEIIERRGLPVPQPTPERPPQQILNIIRGVTRIDGPVIEGEYAVRESVPELDEGGEDGESSA